MKYLTSHLNCIVSSCKHILHSIYTINYLYIPKAHKCLTSKSYGFLLISKKFTDLLVITREKSKNNLEVSNKGNDISKNINVIDLQHSAQKPQVNYVIKSKHFPPANKEWFNSIYAYNNDIKTLPFLKKNLYRLIRGYFNLYSNKLKKIMIRSRSRRFEIRKARQSINKILIGSPELKLTNDKVIITIYVYNAEKNFFINKLKKIPVIYKFNKSFIKKTGKQSLGLKSKLLNHEKSFYFLMTKKNLKLDNNIFKHKINKYKENYIKIFVGKALRKEIISTYFKQLLAFNKAKFEEKFILMLSNKIKKIYNKTVEFNFVNLKHLHLNSHVFSTALVTKIRKLARIKKNFMVAVKKSLNTFAIPRIKSQDIYNEIYNKQILLQNFNIGNVIFKSLHNNTFNNVNSKSKTDLLNSIAKGKSITNKSTSYDILDSSFTSTGFWSEINSKLNFNNFDKNPATLNDSFKLVEVFKSSKNKFINGVRLEIAGRLTRRSGAARSIFKIRNKGNIRNKDSSDKGLSTVVLRGFSKSNLQYNNLHSKVRVGSFGLKGWVSSK